MANTPYKMLGPASTKGKDGGGDCSGITYKGYEDAGRRYSYMQAVGFKDLKNHPNFVKVDTPQPGDIGYVYTGFNHVVVYAGDGYYYSASSKANKFIKTKYFDGKVKGFYRYNTPD
jgi:cell wall-associated NlpC family hydrolase